MLGVENDLAEPVRHRPTVNNQPAEEETAAFRPLDQIVVPKLFENPLKIFSEPRQLIANEYVTRGSIPKGNLSVYGRERGLTRSDSTINLCIRHDARPGFGTARLLDDVMVVS